MSKNKMITVFNKKGGTGKTSLSFNLAKDLDFPLLSNDDSVIEKIYPGKAKILDKIKLIEHDVFYDLGGFIDEGIIEVFKTSSLIIVPTLLDINSIKRTINSIMEINKYNNKIIVVINRVEKKKLNKYELSINALEGLGKELFFIRESEAITNSIHLGKTISQLYIETPLAAHTYKGIYKDYEKLLNRVKGDK
ncbi:MAG: hypothetical protein WC279_09715 [Sulfurimonas sp.]|jgi:cellulose biosynthesis protein BcsQ|uniref:nucleotide-binding protein n=1 Tax=Sulfurimonas sp. TaxID=2022749 RepID=UPI0035617AE9